jgi:hypothetical protein
MNKVTLGDDELVGQTKIDMENRLFTKKWKSLNSDTPAYVEGLVVTRLPLE